MSLQVQRATAHIDPMIGRREMARRLISCNDNEWIYISRKFSLTHVKRRWDKETQRGTEIKRSRHSVVVVVVVGMGWGWGGVP